MSDPSIRDSAPISLCRLCCSKMYSGESMLLMDTEKIKMWFKMYHSVELQVLPGYSNEICRFCVHGFNIVLRGIWGNDKTFSSSEAKLARRTCSDRGTAGWTYCRACLGAVTNPDSCYSVWKYGVLDINALFEVLGFQLNFLPGFPDYLCSLCVSGMHKAINRFLMKKAHLTPKLEDFRRKLRGVPVPNSDASQVRDDLPSIYNPAASIAEVLMSNVSIWTFQQWLTSSDPSSRAPSETSSSLSPKFQMGLTELPPTPNTTLNNPMQPIRPQPMRMVAPTVTIPMHEATQQQQNQFRVNQCLSVARNMLTNMHQLPNQLAVQMAMAQQMGNNPFLVPYHMPYPQMAPNPHLIMQQYSAMHPPVPNLFVKRMNAEELPVQQEVSPVRKRRGRKPQQVQRVVPEEPRKIASRPDQFVMQELQSKSPAIAQGGGVVNSAVSELALITNLHHQVPVIQPTSYLQVQPSPFNHQLPATPIYYPLIASVPSQPAASPAPSASSSSSASLPPISSTSPLAHSLSPSANSESACYSLGGIRITVTPSAENTTHSAIVASRKSLSPSGQKEPVPAAEKVVASVIVKTPLKEEQQLKVPPLKIRLISITPSPEGKRLGLPEIVQKTSSKVDRKQQQITAYKSEETDELSLKNLLDNSPPAKTPDGAVTKLNDNQLYNKGDCSVKN